MEGVGFLRALASLVCGASLGLVGQSSQVSSAPGAIYRQASPAVVLIEVYGKDGKASGQGSGFLVSADGKILTNYHVVAHAIRATVRLANGDAYDAVEVLDVDKRKDIGLLKIKALELPFLTLGRSGSVDVGETIYTLTNPLGLQNSLSQGIISAIRQGDGYRFFQVTAPISPGSSGGPLLNARGEVIGIAAGSLEGQNLNFAIPIDYARGMLSSNQSQPLAAIYEPEPAVAAKPGEPQASAPVGAPEKTAQQLREEFKRASGIFIEKQLRRWTREDAQAFLGEPLRHRVSYDQGGNATADVYAYPDPTGVYRQFELSFARATGALQTLYMFPWDMTWEQCKRLWGDDVRVARNPDGTRFHRYNNRQLTVYLHKDGKVICFFVF